MMLTFFLALVAQTGGDAVSLPPHDWVMVDDAAASDPRQWLGAVREALHRAIDSAELAEAGYPKPCRVTRTPDPGRPGWFDVACVPGADEEPDGVLFDESGRFLQLSVVDFPDSRPYLMEIYVVRRLPDRKLENDERWSIPRVAIHHPAIPSSWHPKIWSVLEEAVRSLGVDVLKR